MQKVALGAIIMLMVLLIAELITYEPSVTPVAPAKNFQALAAEAQLISAEWVRWQTLISLFGIIVATVGVIFIAFTLKETKNAVLQARRANDIAADSISTIKQASVTELRPYIDVKPHAFLFDELPRPDGVRRIRLRLKIKTRNSGKTPGYRIRTQTFYEFTNDPDVLLSSSILNRNLDELKYACGHYAASDSIEDHTAEFVFTSSKFIQEKHKKLIFCFVTIYGDGWGNTYLNTVGGTLLNSIDLVEGILNNNSIIPEVEFRLNERSNHFVQLHDEFWG